MTWFYVVRSGGDTYAARTLAETIELAGLEWGDYASAAQVVASDAGAARLLVFPEQDAYTIDRAGRIADAGKMESERLWAPYFYGHMLDGCGEDGVDDACYFRIEPADVERFPELERAYAVRVRTTNDGFVACETLTRAEYRKGVQS